MKLFDQGIQLLFHKSKISVQKELINIFNYYYSLKVSKLLSILKHSVTATLLLSSQLNPLWSGVEQFVPLCESKVQVLGVSISFLCHQPESGPVPENFTFRIPRQECGRSSPYPWTSSSFCPKYEDLTCFRSGVNRGGALIFGKRLLSVFLLINPEQTRGSTDAKFQL